MIKYNNNTINDWFFSTDNIIKVYRNNAICYYKITSGDTPTPVQEPCFAVVDDISQYSDTEFEDVFNKADGKWYKLNNLDEYEQYGVYGSGRTITTYEGKLTIDTESIPQQSRLPQGYTEVEYVENTSTAYIDTGAYLNTSNFEVGYTFWGNRAQWGYVHQNVANGAWVTAASDYAYFGRWDSSYRVAIDSYLTSDENTIVYTQSGVTVNGTSISKNLNLSGTDNLNASTLLFFAWYDFYRAGVQHSFDSKVKSFYLKNNGILVRDFVPAKRDSDNKYGMYDLITDTFYLSPNNVDFSGGSEVIPPPITATCEFIYSGGSWVNVGEVSGSTIDTVWIDPPSTNNQNASFTVGHYWGEGYKMIMNAYLSGSYSSEIGSFWRENGHTPIEFHFYSNGFYYDFHNPTSTSAPNVATTDYSWRIMKNGTLSSYENSQIFNVILTNGTVRVELEDGTAIVTGSTSVSTQSWYNGLYQVDLGIMSTSNKCHASRIQVYNANDELVNDIKFVKNQGVTGSQEISAYDSVLNVTYNNTNSYTPSYHIVSESGGTEYPMYYDEIQDPPNNLVFSSMTEAEAYECPWVGMSATIDGDKYVFSGDSQSGYEWVYNPSRLPQGYTEVEYVQNTGTSYFNTNFTPNQDTRVVMQYQMVTDSGAGRFWGAGAWDSATGLEPNYEGGHLQISWLGKTSWTSFNNVATDYNKHILDLNKNYLYLDETLVGSNTYTTKTASDPIGVFTYIGGGRPSSSTYWGSEHFKGKMFSFQIYDNGTLVRDLVPCKRDNDNTVGAYDIVNDVFYTVPTGYTTDKLIAGDTV